MKKYLGIAMFVTLGVAASASAANPFSDVPAGHWAYNSVRQLSEAGIVEGYGDKNYGGDRLMTRYEMAQIVAKAMAKGANVDRLASEFADELDTLGVRVARLEEKGDNVKINGEMRYNYTSFHGHGGTSKPDKSILRTRLWLTGAVNNDWKYTAMLENNQNLRNDSGDETTNFQRAYLNGRLGGCDITAGRYQLTLVDGYTYNTRFDGVGISYGKDIKIGAFYGKPTELYNDVLKNGDWNYNKLYGATIKGKAGGLEVATGYSKFSGNNDEIIMSKYGKNNDKNGLFNLGVKYNFGNQASLGVVYLKSDVDKIDGIRGTNDNDGYIITGTIKGAKASKPGSFGLAAQYYDQGYGTVLAPTQNGVVIPFDRYGFKGYALAGFYTVAKNMVASLQYYDLESKNSGDKDQIVWSHLLVTF